MTRPSEDSFVPPHSLFVGRTTVDAIYWLDRIPQEDTKVFADAMMTVPGGPACNAAITHAMLGGTATLMTAIGSGPWADFVRGRLSERRIYVIDVATSTDFQLPLTTVVVARASDAHHRQPPSGGSPVHFSV